MDIYQIKSSLEYIDTALVGIINNTREEDENFSTLVEILKDIGKIDDHVGDVIYEEQKLIKEIGKLK